MSRRQFLRLFGTFIVVLLLDVWGMLRQLAAQDELEPSASGWVVPWSIPWSMPKPKKQKYYLPIVLKKLRHK